MFPPNAVSRKTMEAFILALDYMHAVDCLWSLVDIYYQAGRFKMGSRACCLHLKNSVGPSYRRLCQSISQLAATENACSTHKLLMKKWIVPGNQTSWTHEHAHTNVHMCVLMEGYSSSFIGGWSWIAKLCIQILPMIKQNMQISQAVVTGSVTKSANLRWSGSLEECTWSLAMNASLVMAQTVCQ